MSDLEIEFSDHEIVGAILDGVDGLKDCVDLELALEQNETTITLTKAEIKQLAEAVGLLVLG